jgi:hypothetical protein
LYQGYYVQLDFHGNKYGDQAFYDTAYFIDNWKKLLTWVNLHLECHLLHSMQREQLLWVHLWVAASFSLKLSMSTCRQVLKLKGAKGRIMIDPANEPDGYDWWGLQQSAVVHPPAVFKILIFGFTSGNVCTLPLRTLTLQCSTWASCKGWGTLTKFYTQIFDALYPICKDCLFLVEGAGQVRLPADTMVSFCWHQPACTPKQQS